MPVLADLRNVLRIQKMKDDERDCRRNYPQNHGNQIKSERSAVIPCPPEHKRNEKNIRKILKEFTENRDECKIRLSEKFFY